MPSRSCQESRLAPPTLALDAPGGRRRGAAMTTTLTVLGTALVCVTLAGAALSGWQRHRFSKGRETFPCRGRVVAGNVVGLPTTWSSRRPALAMWVHDVLLVQ